MTRRNYAQMEEDFKAAAARLAERDAAGCLLILRRRHGRALARHADDRWVTLLHRAAQGHPKVCTALLKLGADVNTGTDSGETPLHWAASEGSVPALHILLAAPRVRVRYCNQHGHTPLYWALAAGQVDAARVLVAAGGDLEDDFVRCASDGAAKGCRAGLELGARNVDQALYTACLNAGEHGWYDDVVQSLLDHGAQADRYVTRSRENLRTSLVHIAAATVQPRIVALLLLHGADGNGVDSHGRTPEAVTPLDHEHAPVVRQVFAAWHAAQAVDAVMRTARYAA